MAPAPNGVTLPPGSNPNTAFKPSAEEIKLGINKIITTYEELGDMLTQSVTGFQWRGGPNGLYTLSVSIIEDIAVRVALGKEYFRYFHGSLEPAPEKVGGLFIYWIAKRRPIYFMGRRGYNLTRHEFLLNEYLAIFTGINRVFSSSLYRKEDPSTFANKVKLVENLEDWVYNLGYNDFSSDDMTLALKLLR